MKKLMLLPALLLVALSASTARADHDGDACKCVCECDVCADHEAAVHSESTDATDVVYVSSDDVIYIEEDTRHYDPSTKPSALPNTERRMAPMHDDCDECSD